MKRKELISYILTVSTNFAFSVLEDDDVFTTVSGNKYPAEMVLKNTNISPNEVNYVDLNITISAISGEYVYKSYDKRDNFNLKL